MHAIIIKLFDEFICSIFLDLIFLKDIKFLIIKKNKTSPINIEIKPGKIKAIFQLKNFINNPAIKAPEPMPTPPKIPLIPKPLPFFSVELT